MKTFNDFGYGLPQKLRTTWHLSALLSNASTLQKKTVFAQCKPTRQYANCLDLLENRLLELLVALDLVASVISG
jgi:hypothetical protein